MTPSASIGAAAQANPLQVLADALVERPFRIASVTKLFVGAAVLRLVEEDRLGLDAALTGLVSPPTEASPRRGGHDAARKTLRQLLAHTAGLRDHSQLPAYSAAFTANLQRRWQRDEQIAFGMEGTRPPGKPGESWSTPTPFTSSWAR
jgi:D-alanyl-D-alanine carboxypeptidase